MSIISNAFYPKETIVEYVNRTIHMGERGIPMFTPPGSRIGVTNLINERLKYLADMMTPYSFVIYSVNGDALIYVDNVTVWYINPMRSIAFEPRPTKISTAEEFDELVRSRFAQADAAVLVQMARNAILEKNFIRCSGFLWRDESCLNDGEDTAGEEFEDFIRTIEQAYIDFRHYINVGNPDQYIHDARLAVDHGGDKSIL